MRHNSPANQVFGPAGLTAAGGDTNYDTSAAFSYCINGKAYSKSTVSSGTTPTTDHAGAAFTALAADQAACFLWMVNAAGTVAIAQGPVVDIDGETDDFDQSRAEFPPVPDGYVPFAYQIVQTSGASSAWTFGTSNWNATGITDVIVDICELPDRPQGDARS